MRASLLLLILLVVVGNCLGLATGPATAAPAAGAPLSTPKVLTYEQLVATFGAKVAAQAKVAPGLPLLQGEMKRGAITTPARQAAFLATLLRESRLDPRAQELGVSARYKARGYIQLTGAGNYRAASKALGVNFFKHPELAASPKYSAKIAVWYWTVQRPKSNAAADAFNMGRISRYVGYRWNAREDLARCRAFKAAYKSLSGQVAPAVRCYRN